MNCNNFFFFLQFFYAVKENDVKEKDPLKNFSSCHKSVSVGSPVLNFGSLNGNFSLPNFEAANSEILNSSFSNSEVSNSQTSQVFNSKISNSSFSNSHASEVLNSCPQDLKFYGLNLLAILIK